MQQRYSFPVAACFRDLLLTGTAFLALSAQAQTILSESFDGGTTTTGFTVDPNDVTDCAWVYAPGDVHPGMSFNQDYGGSWPGGGGFDSSFVFLDSDECGGTGVTVDSHLLTPVFDASAPGIYTLSFVQQFRARLASFTSVQVSADGGVTWTEVQHQTGADVGYPNPAVVSAIDISAATNGSANAQVRFEFNAGWDWWWALDNITITHDACAAPTNLAVSDVTPTGASISWDDNGSAGYEWVVTTGAPPDGSNGVAMGDGNDLNATGLEPGTAYTVFLHALCQGGGTSTWGSSVPFTTPPLNDECTGAVPLALNMNALCDTVTPGSVVGATASGLTSTCGGTADDDVWFTFTAQYATQHVSLVDISGSTTDLYFAVWSGACGTLTLVPNSCSDPEDAEVGGLTPGQTYYLQVYTYTSTTGQNTAFKVCIAPSLTIGVQELEGRTSFGVYPVPAEDLLNLRYGGVAARVRVLDALGHTAMEARYAPTLDIAPLAPGSYVVLLLDEHATSLGRARFVKR